MNTQTTIFWVTGFVLFSFLNSGCISQRQKENTGGVTHREWSEARRAAELETIVVGVLPAKRLDAVVLLSHINIRCTESGVDPSCNIILRLPPEVLGSGLLERDILTPVYLTKMNLLAPIGITDEGNLREDLTRLNLRQLLWLVVEAYAMSVNCSKTRIEVGYGFASHDYVSPNSQKTPSSSGNGIHSWEQDPFPPE